MKTDPITMSLLLDEYGALLTEKQQLCCDLYFNQDLSLAEIATETAVSRQGVHDTLLRAEASLRELEDRLGNVKRARELRRAAEELRGCIRTLRDSGTAEADAVAARLDRVAQALDR